MELFGHHIPHKTFWIGAGLIAAAVAVVVFLRARAASQAATAADTSAPQPDQGGYGMTVGAPTQGVADQYQQDLNNAQLQSQNLANQYQQQLATQQQKQFDFQMSQQQALAPAYQMEESAALAAQSHYYKTVADTRISCPGNAGLAQDPNGNLYCRQKTSGGFLGIPIGDIGRTVQNFVSGVEAAAPTAGYNLANEAAQLYGTAVLPGQITGNTAFNAKPPQTTRPTTVPRTPGIAPNGVQQAKIVIWGDELPSAPHGYGEIA